MTEDYLTKREFDGFGKSVQGEFKRIGDYVTQVSAKIDMLLTGRIEEARVMGEITGAIKAINERLERQERETSDLRRIQETEVIGLKAQINEVEKGISKQAEGKVNWFMQLSMLIVAALIGAALTKALFK